MEDKSLNIQNCFIAIMAGGVGSRFWPASRESKPKQFLDILGIGKSLLQMTYDRFDAWIPNKNIYCVTNQVYEDLVQSELKNIPPDNIIGEPSRNNTAPSILLTTLWIASQNPNAVIGFIPSDHLILDLDHYVKVCQEAFKYAEQEDAIVTLGIPPTRPDTGYGYIHFEETDSQVKKVISFKEKPDHVTAEQFIRSGEYMWNAGMFFIKVNTLIEAFMKYEPEMYYLLEAIIRLNGQERTDFIAKKYALTKNISIDYAIMERSDQVYTIPAEIGWSDLGTWASLHQESEKDIYGNVVMSDRILLENVNHSLIKNNTDKLVILRDIDDIIVIVENDVVLVYPMSKEQDIKILRDKIRDDHFEFL